MRPLDTQPTPSVQSGPRRCVLSLRSPCRSTLPSLDVPKSPGSSAPLQAVDSNKELRNAMTKLRLLFKMLQRKNVISSHRGPASMLPNLYPSLPLLRSVLMFLRRSAQGPGQPQEGEEACGQEVVLY